MAKSNPYCLVLTTCPDGEIAEALAAHVVENNVAACVNIIPAVRSIYKWKGKVERSDEHLLLIKSRADCYKRLEAAIRRQHPYELPEVVSVPIENGLSDYLAWIDATLNES